MRKNKKLYSFLLIMLFSIFLISCGKSTQDTNKNITSVTTAETPKIIGEMKVHYIEVGQGDSELIQVDGKNILIDAGTSDKKALNYLKSIGIKTLDYVIATHPHEDHIGSMDDVINTFNIGTFYAPKVTHTTKNFENMVNALKNKNLKMTVSKVGDTLTIGNATLTFLAPNSEKYEDLNNYSIVCKLKYGNNSFLFDGDAEALSEGEILAKQFDVKADVLKVGHHGSTSSTSQDFLNKVNPKYAIISDEKNNDYGHPHKQILDKLNAKGIKIFRTDLNGTIIATSNGTDITFNVKPVDNSVNVAGVVPAKNKTTTKDASKTSTNSATSNSTSNNNSNLTSNSLGVTTNDPAKGDGIVYWTSGGKSYHYDKNCRTLAKSKNILEGSASSCPKTDPCDVCAK